MSFLFVYLEIDIWTEKIKNKNRGQHFLFFIFLLLGNSFGMMWFGSIKELKDHSNLTNLAQRNPTQLSYKVTMFSLSLHFIVTCHINNYKSTSEKLHLQHIYELIRVMLGILILAQLYTTTHYMETRIYQSQLVTLTQLYTTTHYMEIHIYQSQLTMWWVVVQSCTKISVLSLTQLILKGNILLVKSTQI